MYLKKLTNQFCVENRLSYFPFYVQFILSFVFAYSFYCITVSYLLHNEVVALEDLLFIFIFLLIILFSRSLQQLVMYLDRVKPWLLHLPKRLVMQLLFGVILPSLPAAASLAFFFSFTVDGWSISVIYITALYPVTFMLIFTINLLYFIWFFIHFSFFTAKLYAESHEKLANLRNQVHNLEHDSESAYLSSVVVRVGSRRQLVYVKEIGIFEASAERRICTLKQGGASYDFDYSLDMLAARLDPRRFYKVNRRYILNRAVIVGYKGRRNGSLLIRLNREARPVEEITVSRGFAKEFKNWYVGNG